MSFHDYTILGKKGEGTFSQVLKAQHVHSGKYVAIKLMKSRFKCLEEVERLREIRALKRLSNHSNIIQLLEVLYEEKTGKLALIFELMAFNLYESICSRKRRYSEEQIRWYMYQLLKSVDFVHSNGIFHRDIKPENILLSNDQLKLADFGSCRGKFSKQPYTEYISTRWYRSPECILTDGYYNSKMDIWGCGCVFYEMITFDPLFPGENEIDQIKKIHKVVGMPGRDTFQVIAKLSTESKDGGDGKRGSVNHLLSTYLQKSNAFKRSSEGNCGLLKLLRKKNVPFIKKDMLDVLRKLLIYDPDKRITAKQALNHPYFSKYNTRNKSPVSSSGKLSRMNNSGSSGSITVKQHHSHRHNHHRKGGGVGVESNSSTVNRKNKVKYKSLPNIASSPHHLSGGSGGPINNTTTKRRKKKTYLSHSHHHHHHRQQQQQQQQQENNVSLPQHSKHQGLSSNIISPSKKYGSYNNNQSIYGQSGTRSYANTNNSYLSSKKIEGYGIFDQKIGSKPSKKSSSLLIPKKGRKKKTIRRKSIYNPPSYNPPLRKKKKRKNVSHHHSNRNHGNNNNNSYIHQQIHLPPIFKTTIVNSINVNKKKNYSFY